MLTLSPKPKTRGRKKASNGSPLSGQVEAYHLEHIFHLLRVGAFQHFVGDEIDLDHAQHPALFIDHRQREKLVQHEEFAGVEHRRALRNGHHTPDHDVGELLIRRRREQFAGGNDSDESVVFAHHIEIDDLVADIQCAQMGDGVLNRPFLPEQSEVGAGMVEHRLFKAFLLRAGHVGEPSLLEPSTERIIAEKMDGLHWRESLVTALRVETWKTRQF